MRIIVGHVLVGLAAARVADGGHLPAAARAVDGGHDHRGVRAGGGEVEAGDLRSPALVDEPAGGVGDLGEALGAVGGDGEDERLDLGGEPVELDDDRLVVTLALAGQVVPGVDDRAVVGAQLLEPDGPDLVAGLVEHDAGGVEVDVLARLLAAEHALLLDRVPAEAHPDLGQLAAALLLQRDPLALAHVDRHTVPSFAVHQLERFARDLLGGVDVLAVRDPHPVRNSLPRHELGVTRAPGAVRRREQLRVEQRVARRGEAGHPQALDQVLHAAQLGEARRQHVELAAVQDGLPPERRHRRTGGGGEPFGHQRELADRVQEALVAVAQPQQPALGAEGGLHGLRRLHHRRRAAAQRVHDALPLLVDHAVGEQRRPVGADRPALRGPLPERHDALELDAASGW